MDVYFSSFFFSFFFSFSFFLLLFLKVAFEGGLPGSEGQGCTLLKGLRCTSLRRQDVVCYGAWVYFCKKMAHSSLSANRKRAVVGARVYFGEGW